MSVNQEGRRDDLKAKLEKYKRERDELDVIRQKINSKSQERSRPANAENSTFINSGSRQFDKENTSKFDFTT